MSRRNRERCAQLHAQYGKRYALSSQKTMLVIKEHGEEGAAKGDIFSVKPGGGHCRVFQKTTQVAG